jgi:hypothetical protein
MLGRLLVRLCLLVAWLAPVHPAQAQDAPEWRISPDLRIGREAPEHYMFSRISDVEVSPDGTMFVALPSERVIRVYDARGIYQRTIGRAGSGPGEFQRVDSLGFSPEGLFALDRRAGRLTLFAPSGRYIRQWHAPTQPLPAGFLSTPPVGILRNGSAVIIPNYDIARTGSELDLPLLLFDSAVRQWRPFARLHLSDRARRAVAGNLVAVIPQPVTSSSLWALLPGGSGLLIADRVLGSASQPGEVRITRISPAGDTTLSRAYRIPTVPITRDVVERERERAVEMAMRGRPFTRDQMNELYRSGWILPAFQAPVDRVLGGADGSIWLRRGAFGLDQTTWWVLDDRGDLAGRISIPARTHIFRVNRTHVWAMELGEWDEPFVVRYRILRP